MANILVTGAAGFIGFHLCKRLLWRGDKVVAVDNLNNYYDPKLKRARIRQLESLDSDFRNYQIDIESNEAMMAVFNESPRFDAIVHLAGQSGVRYSLVNPDSYVRSNILGFLNMLECCRDFDASHLIYASSSSVYGANGLLPFSVRDNVGHPLNLYAATKQSNELMAHAYSHLFSIPTTGLRFFTTYGPWGRPDMVMSIFTEAILKGKPINVHNSGNMQRDFVYIDDLIQVILRLINDRATADPDWDPVSPNPSTSAAPWRIYNVANGAPVTLTRLISVLEKRLGRTAQKRMVDRQPGEVVKEWGNVDSLNNAIKYHPSTPIEKGVDSFVAWYLDYYGVNLDA